MLKTISDKKKILFLVVVASAALGLGVLFQQIYTYISANDYHLVKKVISNKLEKQGYLLSYQSIEINPSLIPSITLQKVIFKNKDGEVGDNLFEAKELVVNFELISLLVKRDFIVDFLDVKNAKIFITRDKEGNNNWFRSSQKSSKSSNPHISLGQSSFENVDLYYSGPTFTNKKITFNKALIAYSSKGVLVVEDAEGRFNEYQFSLKGDMDSIDSFINSQGAKLDVNFKLDDVISLQLKGDLGSASLPTEKGVDLVARGENLALFIRKIFPNIVVPDTDTFTFKGSLSSNSNGLKLDIADALIKRDENSVQLKGNIFKNDTVEIDLYVSSSGDNLFHLVDGLSFAENFQMYIPQTDAYTFEASLRGKLNSLEANLLKASFNIAEHSVSGQGRVKNLNALSSVDLKFSLKGGDLSAIKEMYLSAVDVSFTIPRSDEYLFDFSLGGGKELWKFSGLKGELSTDDNKLLLSSNEHDFFTLQEIHLNITSLGKDLFHFVDVLGLKEFLAEGMGASNVKHDMKFSVDGAFNELSLSSVEASFLYKENDIKLQGDIVDLNELKNIEMEFDISGNERELAALLGNTNFSDSFFHGTGIFEGDFKEFTLYDFFYQGDRGYSSGNLLVDMKGKPEFRGNLGDTKLFFETENGGVTDSSANNSAKDVKSEFSFAWMDNLDVDVVYDSLFVMRNQAELEILGGKILMKNGKLNWKPFQMKYKGKVINGDLFIDANADVLRFSASANQLDIGALMKDLDWFTRFVGLADIDFKLESKGLSDKELIENLSGKGKVIFHNGKVTDFGSASMSYVQALTPWRKSKTDLDLECFLSNIESQKGVLNFEHLFVENKEMYLTGGGKVNLNNSTIDLAIAPRAKNKKFLDANVSLFIKGPLADPKVQVGKLSAVSDVGLKYGQWALLGPLALALPKLKLGQVPSCEQAIGNL